MADLAFDLAGGLDRVAFARACGYVMDPWQAKVLRSEAKQLVLNCSRQNGKSRVAGIAGLHETIYHRNALVLVIAPALRQSRELFSSIIGMLTTLAEKPTAILPETDVENASALTLANGSRIVCLPAVERTIRCFSGASMIIEDEAAQFPDAVFHAITPMVSVSGGRLMLLSSPFGKRGHFWDVWSGKYDVPGPNPGPYGVWDRHSATALDCPRHTPEFLRGERAKKGDWRFDQEFMCNPPEAPIWMGDFSFKSLGAIKAGDVVVGWHRPTGQKRFLTRSTVLEVRSRRSDIVRVQMESGRVLRCTPDHRWLTMSRGTPGNDWFQPPRVGKKLVRVIDPTPELPDHLRWDAAWLGGIYDGEGSSNHIAQSRTHNPLICERIEKVIRSLGLRASPHAMGFYVLGREEGLKRSREFKQGMVDFLNWTRPTKRDRYMERHILSAHFKHPDRVVDVKPDGHGEVISMQTTTGNYIAWGYASKNCKFVESTDQVFSYDDVMAAFSPKVQPIVQAIAREAAAPLTPEQQRERAVEQAAEPRVGGVAPGIAAISTVPYPTEW